MKSNDSNQALLNVGTSKAMSRFTSQNFLFETKADAKGIDKMDQKSS